MNNLKSLKQTSVFCEGGGRQLIINVLLQVQVIELSTGNITMYGEGPYKVEGGFKDLC